MHRFRLIRVKPAGSGADARTGIAPEVSGRRAGTGLAGSAAGALAGLRDRAAWAGETMPATLRGAGGLTAVNPLSTLTGHTVRLPPSSPPA